VKRRCDLGVILAVVLVASAGNTGSAAAQAGAESTTSRFVDPVNGLSLEQAIARALEQEPSLRSTREQINVAQGTRLQAGLRPNPSVSFEQRAEPGGTDRLTTASIEWPLDLYRRTGRVAVADLELTDAKLAAADRQRLLVADVRTRYGEVLAGVRELALFDQMVTAAQQQLELLRGRVTEGAAPPIDRNVLDVEVRRLRAARLVRLGRVEAAIVTLKTLLGLRPDATLSVRETLDSVVQRERESAAFPAAVSASPPPDNRPDVRQAALRVDLADAKADRAARGGRFDVSLYASYMHMDSGFPQRGLGPMGEFERVRGQFNYIAGGATVSLPLFNRNQGDVASAKAERASATAALDASRLNAEAEIAVARLQYERAREALGVYADDTEDTRMLARQNLTVVGQSYELGRVTVFDVLAEQRRYLDVEMAYADALRTVYEAKTALDLALGGDVR
jgi:cobalt-zinc-cadmium efflux system outer membrane protein